MIINDKYLNSRPKYDIPEGVQIGRYDSYFKIEPSFVPDISIKRWGVGVGVRGYKETAAQICVKSNDSNLISYLKEYDWCSLVKQDSGITPSLNKWQVEKIISEYYEGVSNDNK